MAFGAPQPERQAVLVEALDDVPEWATPIGLDEVDRLKDKPLLDLLGELVEQDSGRVSIDRAAGELVVQFGGDHHQAARFEKLVPAAQGPPLSRYQPW